MSRRAFLAALLGLPFAPRLTGPVFATGGEVPREGPISVAACRPYLSRVRSKGDFGCVPFHVEMTTGTPVARTDWSGALNRATR